MNTKKLTDEKIKIISTLRDRLVFMLEFMQRVEHFPSGKIFEQAVNKAAADGDLRLLKFLSRDIEGMKDAMVSFEREGLEAQVLARFGVSEEEKRQKTRQQAARALARGHVGSEKERLRLEEYVEDLENNGGDLEEIENLSKLLKSS